MAAIAERLSELATQFSQNLLADESGFTLPLTGEDDLAGLPPFLRAAAASAAKERGLEGHVITLSRSLIEPFLVFSTRRDLREKAHEAWIHRGESGGQTDNRAIMAEIVKLRAERARLLGYDSFAHFKLADTMAASPEAAMELLRDVWTPARTRAIEERDRLQAIVQQEGHNFPLRAHDWRHYAEKLRRAEHDLDEGEIKAYLPLERMIDAAFDTATRLFGLTFEELHDVPRYHPEVRAWEVADRDGRVIGLFLGDYFARASKRSGAWMSGFRSQERLTGEVTPIIVNVMNFAKGAEGEPSLLSFDDARTLFHEFGHALHGLNSDVTYPSLSGTAVARDYVEFPSQLNENWLPTPEVLKFLVNDKGQPMPKALVDKILRARTFGQGFSVTEAQASAIVDMKLHLAGATPIDPKAFEKTTLAEIGQPSEIVMRHRIPAFGHIFSGEGYAAGYYSYIWSEVLDHDAFAAFTEAGGPYDKAVAKRMHDTMWSVGNTVDAATAYRNFRGRDPKADALLRYKGSPVPGGK